MPGPFDDLDLEIEEPVAKAPAQAPDPEVGRALEAAAQERAERQRRIQLADEVAQGGILSTLLDATGLGGEGSGRRTHERVQQVWDQITSSDARLGGRNPIDPIVGEDVRSEAPIAGLVDTAMFGERIPALARAAARGEDYSDALAQTRARTDAARSQAPAMYGAGQAAGAVPLMAIPGVQGSTGARVLGGAIQGGMLGAASSLGHSRGEEPDTIAADAAAGTGLGALAGGAGGVLGRLLEGPGRTPEARRAVLQRLAEARDDALLGATTTAGRGQTAIREFERGARDPRAARAAAARALRETDAVPPVGTIRGVSQSLDEAMGHTRGLLDQIAEGMEGGGPTRAQLAQSLRAAARAEADSASGALAPGYADALEGAAARLDEQGDAIVSYGDLVGMTRRLRQMGAGRGRAGEAVSIGREAVEDIDDIVRDVYDDAVERELGAGARDMYQRARGQFRALRTAQGNASTGEAAAAGNRLLGLSEQLALHGAGAGGGYAAGGITGALGVTGAALAARGLRAVEPTLRRTGADLLYQGARRYPRALSQASPVVDRLTRGAAAQEGARGAGLTGGDAPPFETESEAPATDWSDFDLEYEDEEPTP